jgi:hypothetical protein
MFQTKVVEKLKHTINVANKKQSTISGTDCGGPQSCETSRILHLPENPLTDGREIKSGKITDILQEDMIS